MADLTNAEIDNVFYGHTKALAAATAMHAFFYAEPGARPELLERATDNLIEAANAIGCTVKKSSAHLVLMQKTEMKMAKGMDAYASGVVARAAEADELRRQLTIAKAENIALLAQLAGRGEKPALAAVA